MTDRIYRYVAPDEVTPGDAVPAEPGEARFHELPRHVALDETITSQPATTPGDPAMGHDTEADFMLRNAAG